MIRSLILAVVVLASGGAAAAENEIVAQSYRVMAYDTRTHHYTIHSNGKLDGKYLIKKIVVICASSQSQSRGRVMGEAACDLSVGKLSGAVGTYIW